MMTPRFENVDAYIASFPKAVQQLLEQVRSTCKKAAPLATERISYNMPTLDYKGVLLHYAAFAKHIGFYALPSGNDAFVKELSRYKTGKGSIQFPIDSPMPLEIIGKIVKFRMAENDAKADAKKNAAQK